MTWRSILRKVFKEGERRTLGNLVISRRDLIGISRNLQYFSDDLTRRIREAEWRGRRRFLHPVIGYVTVADAVGMASRARESSEKMRELIDMMTEAGVEELKLA
ncbi:MAG: hypothetical protein ACE5Z5_10905 [Candidatus Bathyarchaeia archaeon]